MPRYCEVSWASTENSLRRRKQAGPGTPRPFLAAHVKTGRPRLTERLGPEERPVPELAGPVADLVDGDVLDLHVLEDALEAELAADAALLVAAEGRRGREHVVLVHPHGTGAHLLRDGHRLVRVLRPHRAAEPVDRVVRDADGVVDRLVADH